MSDSCADVFTAPLKFRTAPLPLGPASHPITTREAQAPPRGLMGGLSKYLPWAGTQRGPIKVL